MTKQEKKRRSIGEAVRSWGRILNNNIYAFRYMWRTSKSFFFISILGALIDGLVSPAVLLLNARLYTMLGEQPWFIDALFIELSIVAAKAARLLWDMFYGHFIYPGESQKMHLRVQSDLFEKVRTFELAKYDDPEFYNDFILAMQFADSTVIGAVGNFTSVIRYFLSFSATLALLVYIDIGSMAILLISAVISMVISSKGKFLEFKRQEEYTAVGRRGGYVDRVFKQPDFAKELRLSNIYKCLDRDHAACFDDHIAVSKKYGKKKVLLGILDNVNTTGIYMSVIAITLYKLAVLGTVTIGGFTVIVNANNSFRDSLVQLADMITNLPNNSAQIEKVRRFMEYNYEGDKGELETPELDSIELRDVCFGYGTEGDVLHDVSFKINRGEKISIVGYNGAGKTTLIKLLMRLYEPRSGEVLYNGRSASEYEAESYRGRIGAVFQDYRIFAATIAENVLGGEFAEEDRARVMDALERATFDGKLDELDGGINTMLTREFDDKGTNLSGGEAQKIAIARVFAGKYDLIIMDEPSAALDPMAEYELNKQIAKFASDKTVIFISHRLSTTRHADRIYMFEDGRIVEQGSHDELMKLGGKYAEMFTVQAENYIKNA